MNKTVSVTNMQVKAHAEEGLLINEVADADSTTWDEEATAAETAADTDAIQLRPASTADLATWWHANSLKSNDEAGVDGTLANTVKDSNGNYYTDISASKLTDNPLKTAIAGSQAAVDVYYGDATFGADDQYDPGEGYYVKYTYYIKSSNTDGLTVDKDNFKVSVTASKVGSGTSSELDKALRVGVKFASTTVCSNALIFAPCSGENSYSVTGDTTGTSEKQKTVNAVVSALGSASEATALNTSDTLSIPAVKTDGVEIDVYVWFEGEDASCMSDNLTASLSAYDIDITFEAGLE